LEVFLKLAMGGGKRVGDGDAARSVGGGEVHRFASKHLVEEGDGLNHFGL